MRLSASISQVPPVLSGPLRTARGSAAFSRVGLGCQQVALASAKTQVPLLARWRARSSRFLRGLRKLLPWSLGRSRKVKAPKAVAVATTVQLTTERPAERLRVAAFVSWALNLLLLSRGARWLARRVLPAAAGSGLRRIASASAHSGVEKGSLTVLNQEAEALWQAESSSALARCEIPQPVGHHAISAAASAALAAGSPVAEALIIAALVSAMTQKVLGPEDLLEVPSGSPVEKAPQRPKSEATPSTSSSVRGLVVRIFGRWSLPAEWVNIVNVPLERGGVGEAILRPLASAECEQPFLGLLVRGVLTAAVSLQLWRTIGEAPWGALTADLWRGPSDASSGWGSNPLAEGPERGFELGFEVVEVSTANGLPLELCTAARALSQTGTSGRVVKVPKFLLFFDETLRRGITSAAIG